MTYEQIQQRFNAQPVGRASLVLNDRCGDPSNYLYKINVLAGRNPDLVKDIAVSIVFGDTTKLPAQAITTDRARKLVDYHYSYGQDNPLNIK